MRLLHHSLLDSLADVSHTNQMRRYFWTLTILLAGCAKPVMHPTPSGRPETCVQKATPSQISADLAAVMLDHQYVITQQSDNLVKGDRPIDSTAGAILFGSRYDSTPAARLAFNIVKTSECSRIVADINIVTNPGSAYERLTPMSHSEESKKIQVVLDTIQQKYDGNH